jgi:hypothetical protein
MAPTGEQPRVTILDLDIKGKQTHDDPRKVEVTVTTIYTVEGAAVPQAIDLAWQEFLGGVK